MRYFCVLSLSFKSIGVLSICAMWNGCVPCTGVVYSIHQCKIGSSPYAILRPTLCLCFLASLRCLISLIKVFLPGGSCDRFSHSETTNPYRYVGVFCVA